MAPFLGAAFTRRESRIVFMILLERFSQIDLRDERLRFCGVIVLRNLPIRGYGASGPDMKARI